MDKKSNQYDLEPQEYLKKIMTFTKPNENARRIGQDIQNLEEYDLVDEERINGHLQKRFVRLHKAYFSELLDEMAKGDCFYYTYLDEKDIAKGGPVPKNLSVIIKQMGYMYSITAEVEFKKMYAEAVGSRVLNFFGCSATYNKALNSNGTLFVISLDFLKPNQHFYVAEDICYHNDILVSADVPENLASIDMDIDILKHRINNEFDVTNIQADKERIKRDYIKSYLVRVLLLGDTDFNKRNYGFIYDENSNEIRSAPNYDFELMFGIGSSYLDDFDGKFKYIAEKYPEVMEDFMARLKQFSKKGIGGKSKFDRIFQTETGANCNVLYFVDFVHQNVDKLLKHYAKFQEQSGTGVQKC